MAEKPGAHTEEEPQSERGAKGSRDTGSDRPSAGPADRPADNARGDRADIDTSVKPHKPSDPDTPHLQSGGG
ncbi:hypothetical protein AB0910_06070 [Streptomyces sp. NPDC047002]|uniref:hypothetical protein n=1 Tax=Streptomyces sp. NPDC047002 TaxID=3155475 RepID=UPI003456417E